MNARVPWNCTGKQRKAMIAEATKIEKAVIENSQKNIDVAVLYALHHLCGFGPKRLKQFFCGFNQIYDELVKHYETETDLPWIYDWKLWMRGEKRKKDGSERNNELHGFFKV